MVNTTLCSVMIKTKCHKLQMYFRQTHSMYIYIIAYMDGIEPALFCGCWGHVIMSATHSALCVCVCVMTVCIVKHGKQCQQQSDTSDLSDKQK